LQHGSTPQKRAHVSHAPFINTFLFLFCFGKGFEVGKNLKIKRSENQSFKLRAGVRRGENKNLIKDYSLYSQSRVGEGRQRLKILIIKDDNPSKFIPS
jgi:hypothetical protein